ncbi:MAG: hypothetical protein M5R36_09405 [Deltaproteobacteria bacterium]|nr:hypothetical protein [Deltaproteobacteria bacterium]
MFRYGISIFLAVLFTSTAVQAAWVDPNLEDELAAASASDGTARGLVIFSEHVDIRARLS